MRRAAPIVALFLLSWPVLFGQIRPTPQGVYKVEVTEVPVDLIVLDSKGRPILDLRKEDFEVWEEGVQQPIINFSIELFSGDVAPQQAVRSTLTAVTEVKPTGHRTILLLLGRGRLGWFGSIEQIIDFVRQDLKPNDLVAVMAYNRASPFTTDHQETVRLLEQYKIESQDIESALELRDQGIGYRYRSAMYSPELQTRIDRIFASAGVAAANPLPTSLDARAKAENELGEALAADSRVEMSKVEAQLEEFKAESASRGGMLEMGDAEKSHRLFEQIELRLLSDMPFEDYVAKRVSTAQDIEHIFSAIEYLRFMPGEKHLIFTNDQGLALSRHQHEKGLVNVASDARVRIHSLQTGGMYKGNSGYDSDVSFRRKADFEAAERQRGFVTNILSLAAAEDVAHMTGGLAFVRTDIGKALDNINTATNSLYLLTYRPGPGKRDGLFRKIDVRVKRKGAQVRHRRGYYAVEELRHYDREAFMTYARTGAALQARQLIRDIPLSCQVQTAQMSEASDYLATITLRVKPEPDVFKQEGDRYVGKLAVSYFLASMQGQLLQESWDNVDLNFSEASYQKVIAEGFELKKEFACENGARYFVKIIVYDPRNDRIASEEKDLKKP